MEKDMKQSKAMAYVIVSDRDGVYLGSALGLGFWSKLDPAGQDAAVVFPSPEVAFEHLASWQGQAISGLRCVPVHPDIKGGGLVAEKYASIQACVNAGLEAWKPDGGNMQKKEGIFGYYIDLDERGDFVADVRNTEGKTVFEIRAGNSLGEDESSIFEDGFMRDKNDVSGLTDYLRSMEVISADARVLSMSEFERRLEESIDDELAPR